MRRYLLIGVELVEQLSITAMLEQRLDEAMNKFNQRIAQSNTECISVVV
jgi:hypothetical protein